MSPIMMSQPEAGAAGREYAASSRSRLPTGVPSLSPSQEPEAGPKTPEHVLSELQTLAATAGLTVWANRLPGSESVVVQLVNPETGDAIRAVVPDSAPSVIAELRASVERRFDRWA